MRRLLADPRFGKNGLLNAEMTSSYEKTHTALMEACAYGRLAAVELLLKQPGIIIKERKFYWESTPTPFSLAEAYGHTEIMELLSGKSISEIGGLGLYRAKRLKDKSEIVQWSEAEIATMRTWLGLSTQTSGSPVIVMKEYNVTALRESAPPPRTSRCQIGCSTRPSRGYCLVHHFARQ